MAIETITIGDWDELVSRQRLHALYRGQADASWLLSTSLERACMQNDGDLNSASLREKRMLQIFKRHFHAFSDKIPDHDDQLRWLALMQHHGAPTRLMDWSYSIFVATYFAVENASSECAVWEIDIEWLVKRADSFLAPKGITGTSLAVHLGRVSREDAIRRFSETYLTNEHRFVRAVAPYYRDGRVTAQQGMFTCPGDVSASFMDNLANMDDGTLRIRKYVIPVSLRQPILFQLFAANIGRFSLFPGLDGFSETLRIFHPTVWRSLAATT